VKEGYERRRFTKGGIIILLGDFLGEGSLGFCWESLSSVVGKD
jgi:hypothetical protein